MGALCMCEKRYKIVIDITKDKQEAYISLIEDLNGIIITSDAIINELNKYNICYGINYDNIDYACKNPEKCNRLLIAKGIKPKDGENGKIIFEIDLENSAAPKVLENGRVDFKNLELFKNIRKDMVIARKINPTEGEAGINIFGKKVEPMRGKDVKLPAGKNTIIKNNLLIAAIDGHVSYFNGKIDVNPILELKEVDTSIGNIKTVASVKISGNVKSGFTVESNGDIEVFGVVEASTIIANGNIIIHRGVQGNGKAKIVSGGNISSRYLQNCDAEAQGNIYSEAIIYSNVKCSSSVKVLGAKGQIIGSKVIAANEIVAVNVGSKMSNQTELQAGILPQIRLKVSEITAKIAQNSANIDKIEKIIKYLGKFSDLPDDKRELYIKAKASLNELKNKNQELTLELDKLNKEIKNSNYGIIKISGIVFPGTKIVIDDAILNVKEPIKYSMFVREGADIKLLPLV